MNEKKLEYIQALRGIAALMVAFYHTAGNHLSIDWTVSGVDLFFMISGFIMVYTTRQNEGNITSVKTFFIKRLSRIFPIYAILTIIYIAAMELGSIILKTPLLTYTYKDIIKSIFFIPLELGKASGPIWGGALLHTGWSLNYEVYFYAFFALSLFFGRFRWYFFFAWTALSLLVLPFIAGEITTNSSQFYNWSFKYLNLMTSPLIWEFVIGVIVALIYFSKFKIKSKQACWLLCLTTGAFAAWLLGSGYSHDYGIGYKNYGFPLVFFFSAVVLASKTIEFKVPKALIWLGNISFSLYLVHPIILRPFVGILSGRRSPVHGFVENILFYIFLLCVYIAFSAISYEILEKKVCVWFRRKMESIFLQKTSKNENLRQQLGKEMNL